MDRAIDMAELNLRGGAVGMDVEGEGQLQQPLALVPVDLRLDVDRVRPTLAG